MKTGVINDNGRCPTKMSTSSPWTLDFYNSINRQSTNDVTESNYVFKKLQW
jgi:hypothetical protein